MYGGQGNYFPQFRQPTVPPPPPPSYQQASSGPIPPFLQAPPGPVLPPVPQAPPYCGQLIASQSQPVHFTHPPHVNTTQHYLQLPPPPPLPPTAPPPPQPPPPTQANVSAPGVPPYPLAAFPAPMPLPPPPRMLQPTPQPNSQPHGFHPPHPAIIHAPPRPPWSTNAPNLPPSHPYLELTIPTPFIGKNPAIDAHQPAITPPPPPPPPPPPSSPPPLPPSPPAQTPASEVFPSDSLKVLATDSKADSNASVRPVDNAPVHLVDPSKGFREGNKAPLVDGETSENLSLPPPRPDEAVVRSIEVLCQFIAKVGPDFEKTARAKEAGNPQFAFLFGGEPGSAAAIGHEYFRWMKKKYAAITESPKGLKHKILPLSTLSADVSSQSGMDVAHSPAASDMEMEGE